MIEKVDKALIAWGEQYRRRGSVAALPCVLGTLIDNRGVTIRSTGGESGVALYPGDMGLIGEAVEAALVQVRLNHPLGAELSKLARVRYLTDPMPLVEHQRRRMRYKSDGIYRERLHKLHEALEPYLVKALPWFRRSA